MSDQAQHILDVATPSQTLMKQAVQTWEQLNDISQKLAQLAGHKA